MNSCTTHTSVNNRYHASDMILQIHRDAFYLNEPKGRSWLGGHFF